MAYGVIMPQMGADMKEGTLIRWLKKEGEEVQRGEPIAEIETDKANIEIEAFEGGVFRRALARPGDVVAVGQVIAVLGAPDEDISRYEAPAAASEREPAMPTSRQAMATAGRPPAVAQTQVQQQPGRGDGRVHASPVARRMAEEKGVDLAQVHGTGPEGRITREDVEAFLQRRAVSPPAPPRGSEARPEAKASPPAPVSRMRQAIARRMAASKREAPHYYVAVDIDMTEAQRFRAQLNAALGDEGHVSVNDLLVKASALALQRYPMFNTWFVDEQVQQQEAQNVCIGIALEEGLIAPAILDCGHTSLAEIARASRSLAERAKSGTLKPDEYAAGTFTISNLGMYGIDELIAIIQPPQTAILGVGRVKSQPVARDGAIEIAEVMRAALSGDHRVTDGALGAQFLGEIKRLLESPVSLLL